MNYEVLKDSVADVVKTNGNGEITGALLQQVLLAIINSLGTGYQFMGKATTSTNPGTPDQKEFYIAIDAGVYPNFGNAEIAAGNIGLFLFSSSWTLVSLAVPTKDYVDSTFLKVADLADEIGESTVVAMTQKAVSDALAEKFDASNVVQETGGSQTKVISQAVISLILAGINESIVDIQENYAKTNGTYPELTAGAANNLVCHGDTPAEITYRTAGGSADIGSGTAAISRIKGKTLKFNQFVQNGNFVGTTGWGGSLGTLSASGNKLTFTKDSTPGNSFFKQERCTAIQGHKIYVALTAKCSIAATINPGFYAGADSSFYFDLLANTATRVSNVVTITSNGAVGYLSCYLGNVNPGTTLEVQNFIAVDLTAMFGAGKEPTLAEFEALYPLPYYNYNAGELIHNKATGLKTVGFNQWDEEWEPHFINQETGENLDFGAGIRAKNPIPVFPSTVYYAYSKTAALRIFQYAADGSFIDANVVAQNEVFTTRANTYFIRFQIATATYNNDICINLSWSGYRNGEYEPYWDSLLPLGLDSFVVKNAFDVESTITEGLKSTPNAYDEIVNGEKYIRRTAIRDYESGDESDADVVTDGVHTVYPLGTPEEYTLVTPIATNYRVDDFGTEERLPAGTASAVSAPLVADIQYAMNAVDTLRRLPENYISKSSFDNFCTELADKLGAAIGKTITITATYDSEDKEYDFAITITTPSEP